MKRRHAVLGLAIVAVLSLAVTPVGAAPAGLAKKAIALAKKTDKRSKAADKRSKRALKLTKRPGPSGPAGATGPQGPKGAQGAPGVSGYEHARSSSFANPAGTQRIGSAECPTGKKVLGGGVSGDSRSTGQSLNTSFPNGDRAWTARVNNTSSTDASFQVFAVCAVVR